MPLTLLDTLPEALFRLEPEALHTVLPGPTLIRLPGKKDPPLFVSTLLHGDETTGFAALRIILEKYLHRDGELPRSLVLFLGNIEAAREGLRHLPGQPDYNRIWNGGEGPEYRLAEEVLTTACRDGLFAAVDIHNSSGKNPHYACLNRLEPPFVNLARLFSDILVFFRRPDSVLSNAFSRHCPSVTLESGPSGLLHGIQHVAGFLDAVLTLDALPEVVAGPRHFDVYHSLGRLEVPDGARVAFCKTGDSADFCFLEQLDLYNFKELPAGTLIGWRAHPDLHLCVVDEHGEQVEGEFIQYIGNEIRLARPVIPSMLTTRPDAVYQDCLGYLMERYQLPY